MCEATKQMKTILDGEIKTPVTKAILIFAETVDKSLTNIEGAIYYNSTTKKHYGYNGTNWYALY